MVWQLANNQFNDEGLPELFIRDIPPVSRTNVRVSRPEIYFGESTNHYVIANSKQKEFDYPKDNENRYAHYTGSGGIQLDSLLKRILYAIKLKDIKVLISQNIHSKSCLMYDRNVHVIPKKITPFVAYDNDPYMVITDNGQLKWLIDGTRRLNTFRIQPHTLVELITFEILYWRVRGCLYW